MQSKVYHLFKASSYILVKQMICNYLKYTSFNHHFIIFMDNQEWEDRYNQIFASLGYTSYEYIGGNDRKCLRQLWERMKNPVVYRGIEGKFSNEELALYSFIEKCAYPNLLVHGDDMFYGNGLFRALKISKISRKAWVCWGAIPKQIRKSIYYKLTYGYYRDMFFSSCIFINALLEGDQVDLQKRIGGKITLCPYIDTPHSLSYGMERKNKVLVGNSGLYIDSYWAFVSSVPCKNIPFTFMMSYGCDGGQDKNFRNFADKMLENADFWTENLPLERYLEKVSGYSVYICNVERQTGLGAIQACLSLGLKCYLKGKNLEHFKYLGFKVHSVEELSDIKGWRHIFEDKEEGKYNQKQWLKVFDPIRSGQRWDELFEMLIS